MNLQDYAQSKPGKKRSKIYHSVNKLNFPTGQIQFMTIPDNNDLRKMVDASGPSEGPASRLNSHHTRLKNLVNAWCQNTCSGGWAKLGNPTTWVFELPEDAIMFKFVWYNSQ